MSMPLQQPSSDEELLMESGTAQRRSLGSKRLVAFVTVGALAITALAAAAGAARHGLKPRSYTLPDFAGLMSAADSEVTTFEVTYRDFKDNVPDQQITMFGDLCVESKEIVTSTLGDDNKPVWAGAKGKGGINNVFEFDSLWNTRTPEINVEIPGLLPFTKNADGLLSHDSPEFWPLNDPPEERNLYFSLEMHMHFTYQGNEVFNFRGDDDVFVYIDKQLVVNLGGCHVPQVAKVKLFEHPALQGRLEVGKDYQFDFFFAERRCCGSSLRIDTTIQLQKQPQSSSYKCCLTHCISKSLNWFCSDKKKYSWCDEEPKVVSTTTPKP